MKYKFQKNRKKSKNYLDEDNWNKFDIVLAILLFSYMYPYLFGISYYFLSYVYKILNYLYNLKTYFSIMSYNDPNDNFFGILNDLSLIHNSNRNNFHLGPMKPNFFCNIGMDHNVSMKVIYDIKLLNHDSIDNVRESFKLLGDFYSFDEVNQIMNQRELKSIWYKIPNMTKFKYKIGFHKNKLRNMMEVKDLFVKIISKDGAIFANFAYTVINIIPNYENKYQKVDENFYYSLNIFIMEKNNQYIDTLCLSNRSHEF